MVCFGSLATWVLIRDCGCLIVLGFRFFDSVGLLVFGLFAGCGVLVVGWFAVCCLGLDCVFSVCWWWVCYFCMLLIGCCCIVYSHTCFGLWFVVWVSVDLLCLSVLIVLL